MQSSGAPTTTGATGSEITSHTSSRAQLTLPVKKKTIKKSTYTKQSVTTKAATALKTNALENDLVQQKDASDEI